MSLKFTNLLLAEYCLKNENLQTHRQKKIELKKGLDLKSRRLFTSTRYKKSKKSFYLMKSIIGVRIGFNLAHTVDTMVANIWPTSAITERVNGIPTIENRTQKARPDTVTGAIFP